MRKSIFLLLLTIFIFSSCDNEDENYIEKIEYFRFEEEPGPDKIEFNLKVSKEVFDEMCEDSLTRQIFVINKVEKIDYPAFFFGLEKLKRQRVKYTFVTPYFKLGKSKLRELSENDLNEKFNNSKDLKLILHFNEKVFEFKNK